MTNISFSSNIYIGCPIGKCLAGFKGLFCSKQRPLVEKSLEAAILATSLSSSSSHLDRLTQPISIALCTPYIVHSQ